MKVPTVELSEGDVKAVVAWGSLSYAFGFATVMLHTWRLGFPVLELLSAVYVWVGLPLTLVVVFSKQLVRYFAAKGLALGNELRTSWEHLAGDVQKDARSISQSFVALVSVLPIFRLFRSSLERLIERASLDTAVKSERAARTLRRLTGLLRGMSTLADLMRTINLAILIVVGMFLYVWVGYPLIPQSLGGGQPATVRLLILTDKASAFLPQLQDAGAPAVIDGVKTALTAKMQLLYATKDNYYLSTQAGMRLSLSKDTVAGVVWNP